VAERYRKGKVGEFHVMRELRRRGFFVMRAPASGRSRRLVYPDIIAVKKGLVLIVESKLRDKPEDIYVAKSEYRKYMYMSKLTGGIPLLCVYFESTSSVHCIEMRMYSKEAENYYVYTKESLLQSRLLDLL